MSMKGIVRYYAHGAGRERDGCAWCDVGEHGSGCGEPAGGLPGKLRCSAETAACCYQMREVFGKPRVLDIAVPLDRNGQPFLVVHVGVRSTFLRASYEPWLRDAHDRLPCWRRWRSMVAAALLANAGAAAAGGRSAASWRVPDAGGGESAAVLRCAGECGSDERRRWCG